MAHFTSHKQTVPERYYGQVDTDVGAGFEGLATALSLDSLGVDRGGLFWFFNPTNPELLMKSLNGCNVTGHWRGFLSAGTTVRHPRTLSAVGRKNDGFRPKAREISCSNRPAVVADINPQ